MALAMGLGVGLEANAEAQAGNAPLPAAGAQAGNASLPATGGLAVKRLILTDGGYQTATEWKKSGERVEYFSAERSEWEELPAALVDWKATDEWNSAAAQSQADELKQVSGEEVAARKEAEMNTPQVAPKLAPELRLPADGGVFLLEERAGKAVLLQVPGNKTEEDDHEGENRLRRSIVSIASQLQTIELKGAAAKVRLHAAAPAIFVDVENDQGVIAGDSFRIVRLAPKRGLRVVSENKIGQDGSENSKEMYLHSRAEKFSGDWWKVIPLEDLTPGEYAIVIEGVWKSENGVVWDFGVDK
jgi:hypothetical protein